MVECDSSAALSSGPDSSRLSMTDRLKRKKQKFNEVKDRYINCDFIFGSVAEVERLWSLAKYIIADTRKSTSPLVFEAILFLKVNANCYAILTTAALVAAFALPDRAASPIWRHRRYQTMTPMLGGY